MILIANSSALLILSIVDKLDMLEKLFGELKRLYSKFKNKEIK